MKKYFFMAVMFQLAILIAQPVAASDNEAPSLLENPYKDEVEEKARALQESLSEEEIERMGQLRNAFGVVRSIRHVRKSVSDAVDLCAKENPSLSKDIKAGFRDWDQDIRKNLNQHEKHLKNSVHRRYFDDPRAVQAYLDTLDKAAAHAENSVERVPVTTEEACQGLMASMDNTKEAIGQALGSLSWPASQ